MVAMIILLLVVVLAGCALPPIQEPTAGSSLEEPLAQASRAPTAKPEATATVQSAQAVDTPVRAATGPARETQVSNSLMLEIPKVVTPAADIFTQPVVSEFESMPLSAGDEFTIDPAALGPQPGQSVGALKLRLIEAQDGRVTIEALADRRMDGKFYPRDPIETVELPGSCIRGFPLVMDVRIYYCFEVLEDQGVMKLYYRVEEESTLPPP